MRNCLLRRRRSKTPLVTAGSSRLPPLPTVRMAWTSSSPRICLRTYPSATATASRAEQDSAVTMRSSVAARRALMPLRTTSWSSTSMTRSIGELMRGWSHTSVRVTGTLDQDRSAPAAGSQQARGASKGRWAPALRDPRDPAPRGALPRDQDPHDGAVPRDALQLQGATQRARAGAQVAEAVAGGCQLGVEAAPVVVDLQDGEAAALQAGGGLPPVQRDPAGGGAGVPDHVGQRLADQLHQVAGVRAERGGDLLVDLDHGGDAGGRGDLVGHPPQHLVDVAAGQHPGPQPEDVAAQVADDPVQLADRAVQPAGDLRLAGARRGRLQAHADREQRLDGAVVQVPGDALALLHDRQAAQLAVDAG